MNWKNLFVNGEENTETKKEHPKTESPVQTLTSVFGFNTEKKETVGFPSDTFSSEHLEKAIEIYQKGFDSLNQPGYDFYEFYQTVVHGGIENPQIYSMAYAMGTAMDKTITKDKLLQQSDFYLNEIHKVYTDNVNKGSSKKQSLLTQKSSENQALSSELDLMRQQMEALKLQIQDRENKLNAIDSKYLPMIKDIDSKMAANETANNKIVQSIQQVKNGIYNNIK